MCRSNESSIKRHGLSILRLVLSALLPKLQSVDIVGYYWSTTEGQLWGMFSDRMIAPLWNSSPNCGQCLRQYCDVDFLLSFIFNWELQKALKAVIDLISKQLKVCKKYSVTVYVSYFELSSHVWKCGHTWPLCLTSNVLHTCAQGRSSSSEDETFLVEINLSLLF